MDKDTLWHVRDLILTSASTKQNIVDLSAVYYCWSNAWKIRELKKQCVLDIEKIFTIVNHRKPSDMFPFKIKNKLDDFVTVAKHVDFNVSIEDLDVIFGVLSEIKDKIDVEIQRQTNHTKSLLLNTLHSVLSQPESIKKPVIVEKPIVAEKPAVVQTPLYQKNLFVLNHYLADLKKLLHIQDKLIDKEDIARLSNPARYEHITALSDISAIIEKIGEMLSFKAGDLYKMIDKDTPYSWCLWFLKSLRHIFQWKLEKRVMNKANGVIPKKKKKKADSQFSIIHTNGSTYTEASSTSEEHVSSDIVNVINDAESGYIPWYVSSIISGADAKTFESLFELAGGYLRDCDIVTMDIPLWMYSYIIKKFPDNKTVKPMLLISLYQEADKYFLYNEQLCLDAIEKIYEYIFTHLLLISSWNPSLTVLSSIVEKMNIYVRTREVKHLKSSFYIYKRLLELLSKNTDVKEVNDLKIIIEKKYKEVEAKLYWTPIVEEKKDAPKEETRIDIWYIDPRTGRIKSDFD